MHLTTALQNTWGKINTWVATKVWLKTLAVVPTLLPLPHHRPHKFSHPINPERRKVRIMSICALPLMQRQHQPPTTATTWKLSVHEVAAWDCQHLWFFGYLSNFSQYNLCYKRCFVLHGYQCLIAQLLAKHPEQGSQAPKEQMQVDQKHLWMFEFW